MFKMCSVDNRNKDFYVKSRTVLKAPSMIRSHRGAVSFLATQRHHHHTTYLAEGQISEQGA
jgi:hypothetical protein